MLVVAIVSTFALAWFIPWLLTPLPKWAERPQAQPQLQVKQKDVPIWVQVLAQVIGSLISG